MQPFSKLFSIPVVLMSLTACGGGGGGDDDGAAELYTGSKEEVVIEDAATAESTVSDVRETLDSVDFDTSYKAGSAQARGWAAIDAIMERVSPWNGRGADRVAGVSETEPCDEGSVSVSSSGEGEAGSTASLTFNNCVFYFGGGGLRFTGAMEAEVLANSGDPYAYLDSNGDSSSDWAITYAYNLSRWKVEDLDVDGTATGDYGLMHGGFRLEVSYVGASGITTERHSGSAMYFDTVTFGERTETLFEDFTQTFTENWSTSEATYSNDMTLTSTAIDGKVVVDTVTPFRVPGSGYYYPQEGQMVVTAAGDAKVRLTAIGNNQATIEYDVSPVDGTYETSVTRYWYQL